VKNGLNRPESLKLNKLSVLQHEDKNCPEKAHIDSIAICDSSLVEQNRANFLNLTRQAMAF
jgi:hypothetical protein